MINYRNLYNSLEKHLDEKPFTILTGARQTGKTSILKMLLAYLQQNGRTVHYFTLEDIELRNQLNDRPQNLFKITGFPKEFGNETSLPPAEKLYVLIDEIQYLNNPSNFLKLLYDLYAPVLKLVVTGSSAFYIDNKFKDSLAGRKRIFWLKTLNFDEFLVFRKAEFLLPELHRLKTVVGAHSLHNDQLRVLFDEYLTYGGYPAVVLEPDQREKIAMLNEIKNAYIRRDIYESNVSNEVAFMHLLQMLAAQCGALVNRNELSVTLKIDNKTVDNYLHVLRKCFHIELLKPFLGNIRKELTKMPKVYFYDLGLRNAMLNRFEPVVGRDDRGVIIENYAFKQLTDLYGLENINFWRTTDGHEVDFIVSEQYLKGRAFEVKFDASVQQHSKYKLFTSHYPQYPLSLISFMPVENTIDLMLL